MGPERTKPTTVDDYIAAAPTEVRRVLREIRARIRDIVPEATERLSYGMPTFFLGGVLMHYGAFKTHIGIFPPVGDPRLEERTRAYRGEKGNLRFPLDQPIPYALIEEIAMARVGARPPASGPPPGRNR
jgi:uncharacterized protein YdhG (YjbR/CyaY superfamily)